MPVESEGADAEFFAQYARDAEAQFRNTITSLLEIGRRYIGEGEHRQQDLRRALSDLAGDELELRDIVSSVLDIMRRGDLFHYMEILLEAAFIVGSHGTAPDSFKAVRTVAGAEGGKSSAKIRAAKVEKWQAIARKLAIAQPAMSQGGRATAVMTAWPDKCPVEFDAMVKYMHELEREGVIARKKLKTK